MLARNITAPRHQNAPRLPEKDAKGFLQYVRGRGCIYAPMGGCAGKMEPQHLDFAGGKGMGSKVADRYCVPACSAHHALQHKKGWQIFMALMGTNANELLIEAARLWNKWPGRPNWERKQESGR